MYYLHLNGSQVGPYSLEQLKSSWKEGSINAQTPFWQEGMPTWQPLENIQNLLVETSPSRIIAGFWRRLGAYALDSLLLGVLGFVLCLLFFNFFSTIGPWALLVGFTISLGYFGVANSSIGQGRTLGKRLLGIEVVNHAGQHISPASSALRYIIFAVPFYANGIVNSSGQEATSWPSMLLGLVIFGIGGAIAYLIFNRRTRQSLHDLAVGTYVVRTPSTGSMKVQPIWRGHLVAVGILFAVMISFNVAAYFMVSSISKESFLKNLLGIQKSILASGKVQGATVTEGTNWSSFNGKSQTAHVLSVRARWKGRPVDYSEAAKEIAAIVLKEYPDVMNDDDLAITIAYQCDIGIFSSSVVQAFPYSPEKWQKLIEPTSPVK